MKEGKTELARCLLYRGFFSTGMGRGCFDLTDWVYWNSDALAAIPLLKVIYAEMK